MERIPTSYVDNYFAEIARRQADDARRRQSYPALVSSTPQSRNSTPNPDYVDPVTGRRGYDPVGAVGAPHEGKRCEGNSSCIPICPVQAKWNAGKTAGDTRRHRRRADAGGRLAGAAVERPVVGDRHRVHPLRRRPGRAPPEVVTADVYVLGGHAIENAKLLLASGAANSSDQVGRNLMDHPYRWRGA